MIIELSNFRISTYRKSTSISALTAICQYTSYLLYFNRQSLWRPGDAKDLKTGMLTDRSLIFRFRYTLRESQLSRKMSLTLGYLRL